MNKKLINLRKNGRKKKRQDRTKELYAGISNILSEALLHFESAEDVFKKIPPEQAEHLRLARQLIKDCLVEFNILKMLNSESLKRNTPNAGDTNTVHEKHRETYSQAYPDKDGKRVVDSVKESSGQSIPQDESGVPVVPAEPVPLTKREIEILRLIADEYTNRQIADRLFISKRTVDTHRTNLLNKTNSKNTAGLVRYACRHRLI